MQKQHIRLHGVLIPVEWDSAGNTTALAIATNEEEEYFIESMDTAEELFSLLQQEVEIAGWYRQKAGKNTISIDSYRLIGKKDKYPLKRKK